MLAEAVYLEHDLYKFPPGSTAAHAELMKRYPPVWSGRPDVALLAMAVSLGAGVPFYSPAILICLSGFRAWWTNEKLFCLSLSVAMAVFILFISQLTFFKGDTAWGPRYLTPIFAILWLFAPAGSRFLRKWMVVVALGLGLIVQMNALCIDPHRLYVEHGLPSSFYVNSSVLYFHPSISHVVNRPREIVEVLSNHDQQAEHYSPSSSPTIAVNGFVEQGPAGVQKYHVLNGFRFWWASFLYLDRTSRPVEIVETVIFLAVVAVTGLTLQAFGLRTVES